MESPDTGKVLALAAFSGWNDAGSASTEALSHLMNEIGIDEHVDRSERIVDANNYVDFQINRPTVSRDDDGARVIEWPHTRIFSLNVHDDMRIVIVAGPEPSFNWQGYCEEILGHLRDLGVTSLVTLGGLLADTPHTRPLPVSITHLPRALEFEPSEPDSVYEGPIGIPTILADVAAESGMPTTSIWVQVPNYVGQNPAPKATLALINALESSTGIHCERADLVGDAEAWERGMTELAHSEDDISVYVQQLESIRDAADLPEASGEDIASEFEEFLRGRRDDR